MAAGFLILLVLIFWCLTLVEGRFGFESTLYFLLLIPLSFSLVLGLVGIEIRDQTSRHGSPTARLAIDATDLSLAGTSGSSHCTVPRASFEILASLDQSLPHTALLASFLFIAIRCDAPVSAAVSTGQAHLNVARLSDDFHLSVFPLIFGVQAQDLES